MRLLLERDVPRDATMRRFGVSAAPALLMLLGVLWPAAPVVMIGRARWPFDALEWSVLVVGGAIVGGVWLLCVLTMWWSFRAAVRREAWVMQAAADGVYLKFRSYLNHHFDPEAPTVVFLPWAEIERAGRVTEILERTRTDGSTETLRKSWLELRVRADVAALAEAVDRERREPGPERVTLGVRSRGRAHHVPVMVAEPGVIRAEWHGRGMLRALAGEVAIEASRAIPLHPADRAVEDRILDLLERGETIAAIEVVRDAYGLTLTDAHAFVHGLRA